MGYPGSMGASFIDYFVGDDITIPAEARSLYSEAILYMPNSY